MAARLTREDQEAALESMFQIIKRMPSITLSFCDIAEDTKKPFHERIGAYSKIEALIHKFVESMAKNIGADGRAIDMFTPALEDVVAIQKIANAEKFIKMVEEYHASLGKSGESSRQLESSSTPELPPASD